MNHLIVYANPTTGSFTHQIAARVQKTSEEIKVDCRMLDLYAENFDPVLSTQDILSAKEGAQNDVIARYQQELLWADVISFVYPLWWTGLPAILKGYVDRVFSYGFAYQNTTTGPKGLLTGKKAFVFVSAGASIESYQKSGMLDALKQTVDTGIFEFCGIKVLEHIHFGGVVHGNDQIFQEAFMKVDQTIRLHLFPRAKL